MILNNQGFLWEHPKLNSDYAVPSGLDGRIGWHEGGPREEVGSEWED